MVEVHVNPFLSPSRVRLEASSSSLSLSPPVWDARSAPCPEREAREAVYYVQVLVGGCMKRRSYTPTRDRVTKMSLHNSFDLVLNSFVGGGCGAALATCLGAGGKIRCCP